MIPKTWDKVPLKNFTHYLEYNDEKPETDQQRFDLLYKRTCAILDCDIDTAKKLTGEEQMQLIKLFKTPMPTRLMLHFKHKGHHYKPIIQAKKLTGARYAAIKNLGSRGLSNTLHQVMFLVCEPVKFGFRKRFPFIGWKPYEIDENDIAQRIEDFKTLPMEVVNPISIFFLKVSESLKSHLDDYLMEELQRKNEELEQLQVSLEKDMDGLQ